MVWTLAFELPVAALEKSFRYNVRHRDSHIKVVESQAVVQNLHVVPEVVHGSTTMVRFRPEPKIDHQIPVQTISIQRSSAHPVQYQQDQKELVKRGLDIQVENSQC